jgi:flagellar basal body-associated protein FliL
MSSASSKNKSTSSNEDQEENENHEELDEEEGEKQSPCSSPEDEKEENENHEELDEEEGEKQSPCSSPEDEKEEATAAPSPEVVEEESSQAKTKDLEQSKRKRTRLLLLVLLAVLLLTGLIVGLVVGLKQDNDNPMTAAQEQVPTSDDSIPPSSQDRLQGIQTWLVDNGISSAADFENPSSPQSKALTFVAIIDELQLDILPPASGDGVSAPRSTTSNSILGRSYTFLTRYVTSVLYYSTGGPQWNYNLLFLSKEETCNWFLVFPPPVGQVGVLCKPTTQAIVGFSFSKFDFLGEVRMCLERSSQPLTTLFAMILYVLYHPPQSTTTWKERFLRNWVFLRPSHIWNPYRTTTWLEPSPTRFNR